MRGLMTIVAALALASCALRFPDKQPGDTSTSDAPDGTDMAGDVPGETPVDVPDDTPDGAEDPEVEPGCGNGVTETSLDEECDEGTGTNCDIRGCTCTTDCRNVWIIEHEDTSIPYLTAVWTSGTDAVAVGHGGISLVRDPGTGVWSSRSTGTTENLEALAELPSGTDVLAAGDADTVLRWNGSTWNPVTDLDPPASGDGDDDKYDILDISCWWTSPYQCFFATREGYLLTRSGSWSFYRSPTASPWTAVGGVDVSGVVYGFAVGWGGQFSSYHSSTPHTWADASTPIGTDNINDIWVEAHDSAYTVQDSGQVQSFNGSTWSAATVITAEDLHGIAVTADFIFAVGDAGTIISWERAGGGGWVQEPTFVTENLRGVATSSGLVLAVGQDGIVLRRP